MIAESNTITLMIPGQPVGKNRPRFTRVGKGVRTYSDQGDEEQLWVMVARQQIQKLAVRRFSGAVEVKIIFWFKRPVSHFGSGKNAGTLKPSAPGVPTTKPDNDNLVKHVMDCLNHCDVWVDDSYVVGIHAIKRYTRSEWEPRTEVLITESINILRT